MKDNNSEEQTNTITWKDIDQLIANPNLIMETSVPGTGKDGGPNCATVKPFNGWKIIKRK